MQYKEMYFDPWFLRFRVPDNCVYLTDSSVVVIDNIIIMESSECNNIRMDMEISLLEENFLIKGIFFRTYFRHLVMTYLQ
jgi:hypothetical protein